MNYMYTCMSLWIPNATHIWPYVVFIGQRKCQHMVKGQVKEATDRVDL